MINNTIEKLCAALPANSIFAHYWVGNVSDRFGTIAAQLPYNYGQLYITKVQSSAADLKFTRYGEAITYVSKWTSTNNIGWSGWVDFVPTTLTVNGKALTSNITLSASDVGAAASSHGNHVPTTQTANNKVFLRNDNTWQTVTPANIGAAASSHTHTKSQITDFPTSMPASDVYSWAKASSKPSYSASEVGAAPSGYGLGGPGITTSNCNNILYNGWYSGDYTTTSAPCNWFSLLHLSRDNTGDQNQIGLSVTDYTMARRYKVNGSWAPWAYDNPPMNLGTEYLTTEHFFGKAVYKKVIDVGYLDAGIRTFNHGISNIDECIHCEMINEGYGNFTAHCDMEFSQTGVYLNMPWAAGAIRCILSYTKN